MEKEFERVRSVRDIVISMVMTVAGVVCVMMPTSVSVNILGTCLAIPGILMLLFMKTDYMNPESGERFRRIIRYYPASRKSEIMDALKNDPSRYDWKEDSAASGIMLDIYYGKSVDKVYVRVLEFIPYNYQPCSSWHIYDVAHAAGLLKK